MGNGAASRPPAARAVPAALGLAIAALVAAMLARPAAAVASSVPPPPKLAAKAAVLTVLGTGQKLYGLNAEEELPIASTTKLMTALQVLEHASLNTVVTEPDFHFAADDSQIYLTPGERMSIHDLMVAMLLPSADDAAEDLAYNVGGGSVERFIAMMNQGARALQLDHTHYSTPIGLDTPGNYSTASDLVKLAGYLLKRYPFFAHVVALPAATLTTGNHPRYVVNRNDLVARFSWIHGVKTGHTSKAGYVLVGEGSQAGMTLLSAVLGTPSETARDDSTLALLDWGYANFHMDRPLTAGEVVSRPTANGYSDRHVSVIAGRSFSWVVPRGARLRLRIRLAPNLNGPLKRHARVGSVTILEGIRPVGRVRLLLERSLAGLGPLTQAARFITKPISLVVLIVILTAAALTVVRRSRRRVRSVRA
jgi:D-alanyl-D-alanine carboxypeptidase (penicillin-binding protein 5/6)